MKTKIAIILIVSGIVVSFGATKIGRARQSNKKTELQSSKSRTSEPIGGFALEEH